MPEQYFTGNNQYDAMACHVFALSGDFAQADNVNKRYIKIGDILTGKAQPGPEDGIALGVTAEDIGEVFLQNTKTEQKDAIMRLLCKEFHLVESPGSGVKVWGHIEDDQMLPEHMYVTAGGRIFDTMPNQVVRRDADDRHGRNPPSNDGLLPANVVYFIEVEHLAAGTQALVDTPDAQWAAVPAEDEDL